MPRNLRSIKSIVVEAFFLVVVFTIVGHLTFGFWERYFIQSELTHVKDSLHTLKKTLANIGDAYDNLYNELTVVFDKNKSFASLPASPTASRLEHKLRNKYTLDRRIHRDVQVHAALTPQNVKNDKPMLKTYFNENAATQSILKNGITKSPLKVTAFQADHAHDNCRHHKHYHTNSEIDENCIYNRITDHLKL